MPSWFDDLVSDFGSGVKQAGSNAQDYFTSPEGIVRLGSMGLSAIANRSGKTKPVVPPSGYQGGIPTLAAMRQEVPMTQRATPQGGFEQFAYDPSRRPGSGGRRYFTDTRYVTPGETATGVDPDTGVAINRSNQAIAQEESAAQAEQLMARNMASLARQERKAPPSPRAQDGSSLFVDADVQMAQGGLASLGMKKGKYLNGSSDGMADEVPASIEGRQPAALSDGEFVIPADVVSHLGNGNSDAGAKVLEQMMTRIRKQRTGNDKQGKEINPRKILPA